MVLGWISELEKRLRHVLVIFVAEVALAIAETLDAERGDARG
jgi:hypothetical protein